MRARITLTGADAIRAKLSRVDPAAKKGAKKGVLRAGRLALAAEKSGLSHDVTGLLRKSLGVKVVTNGDRITAIVGPRRGFRTVIAAVEQRARGNIFIAFRGRKTQAVSELRGIKLKARRSMKIGKIMDPAKYGPKVERGHAKGKGHGAAKAHPFVGPAMDRVRAPATAAIAEEIQASIKAEAAGR